MLELHNVRMEPSNVKKKVTWYSKLPTSGYGTPFFFSIIELPYMSIIDSNSFYFLVLTVKMSFFLWG